MVSLIAAKYVISLAVLHTNICLSTHGAELSWLGVTMMATLMAERIVGSTVKLLLLL